MNIYFIIAFAIIMLVAIGWFRKIWYLQVNAVASIVTIIGVLGTFLGIAIGLYQFDTGNIEASVPKLLEGLKIAFITSILGIVGSIALKWLALNKRKSQAASDGPYTGATADDLAGLLRDILDVEREEGNETRETLRSIEKSLTGDGDSTVLTQLQKLRTAFSDKQDDLIRAFNKFADQMAKNNTDALIKALKEVIKDFNAKINEQFGDNFKQLNEAVGKINEWQEQYRQQMDELAAQFQVAAASIEKSRESLEIIAERSESIVSSSERLNPILEAIQNQIDLFEDNLEAFQNLANNAGSAFPIIEGRLNQLTNNFSTVVQETIDNSHASMQSQREALTNQSQQLEKTVENTSRHIQEQTEDIFEKTTIRIEEVIDGTFQGLKDSLVSQSQQLQSTIISTNQGLETTLQNQSTQLETIVVNTNGQLRKIINDFSTIVKETIDDSGKAMENQRKALVGQSEQLEKTVQESTRLMAQQITILDEALGKELTKALNSLGSQLTSLSEKFVTDYTPLTNELRKVVQMVRRIDTNNASTEV